MPDSVHIVAYATQLGLAAERMTDRADHIGQQHRRSTERVDRAGPFGEVEEFDPSLIARGIAARDTDALGQLYDWMGRRAYGLAFRVTGDSALAEDAVQDAFLSLWRQAELVRESRGKIESLLLTMVHRRAVDQVRKQVRRERTSSAIQYDFDQNVQGDPEQMAVLNSEHADAVEALNGLPDEQKHVIELAYFRGLTQREIADETGASLGTVKGRMRLGLDKLRGAFGMSEEKR